MPPRPGSLSDSGMLYQYAVTASLAAQLSTNNEVEDYVIYSSEAPGGKFDDIVARVKLKQSNDWHLWLLQTKYRKSRNLSVNNNRSKTYLLHYITSFKEIISDDTLECRKGISSDNIVFGLICNKSIETPIYLWDPTVEIRVTCSDNENSSKAFLPIGTKFNRFECQDPSYSNYQQFFNNCFLWLEQKEKDIDRDIEQKCELGNASDIITYIQAYFHNQVLIQQGLKKEVFEIELQKIRLLSFIPPISKLVDLADDSWINIWNEITLEHDITIVDDSHDSDIHHYLYRCLLQQLNSLLHTNIDWNIHVLKERHLNQKIIDQFEAYAVTKPLRYWITPPSTLRSLMLELWKCGDLPLVLKTNVPLKTFEKHHHLKRSYIVVDDLEQRAQEILSSQMKIFHRINGITNAKLRSSMLQKTLVSLQGRQEMSLQNLLHEDEKLMAAFTCADIIRIMKRRVKFLQEDALNKTNYTVYIITNDKYKDVKSLKASESGGTIKVYCNSNKVKECLEEIQTNPELEKYTIYQLRQVRDQFELIQGDATRLSSYIIDQFGNPLYTSEKNKCIPIIGQPVYLEKQQYLTRKLSRATVSKSFFHAEHKRICLLSGELNAAAEAFPFTNISEKNFGEKKCYFVKVEGGSSQNYWEQLQGFGCIYDINIKENKWELLRHKHYFENGSTAFDDHKLELLQCQNCKDLGSNISYQGEELPEDKYFETIRNNTNEIIVITGEAGIGKSCLLKSLFYNCSLVDYVLFYDLIYFQASLQQNKNPCDDPLNFIMKEFHKGKSEAYYDFLYRLLEQERLILILDSFDEVMLTCRKEVLQFIRCIVKRNIRTIIATREKEFMLIDQFNAQTVKINPFDSEADDTYLMNWDLSRDALKNVSPELITNPLYLTFLRVIASNQKEFAKVTKFTLYEKVIEMKIHRWLWKYCNVVLPGRVIEMVTTFQQLALVRMFGKDTIEEKLKWKCDATIFDYVECGIICRFDERGYPVFHHYTFVEFLVAQWIINATGNGHKKLAVYLYEQLFLENKYDVLKILAEYACVDLGLHIAIWQVDVHKVETLGELYDWNTVDILGRTALHVTIICCSRLDHRFVSYEILEYIVKCTQKYADMNKSDVSENYWIDYVQPAVFEYACIYECRLTIETYLSSVRQSMKKRNIVFPLKKFKNIFSWALSSLPIESIGNLLLFQNLNTPGFYPYYNLCLNTTDIIENYNKKFEIEGNLTALHIACIYGNVALVRHHIETGTNVDIMDRFSYTPLCYSIKRYVSVSSETACEDEETIRLLLENGADPKHVPEELITINENDHTFSCRKTAVKHILENTRNVSTDLPNNPKTKIDVNTSTPLHDAVLAQNIILLKNLVTDGTVDINKQDRDGRTALKLAAIKGHQNIVGCLLQSGADANIQNGATDETALHCAAGNGCITIVKMLLDNGADLNIRDIDDSTPLFYAAYSGHADIIKLLLEYKTGKSKEDVNVQNIYGSTPLHIASGDKEKVDVVRVLIEHGANVNATDKHNSTPLHFATEYKNKNVVALLLENGANPNAESIGNYTPLHFAAKWEEMDIVDLLLSKAVEINIRSTHNLTPLDLAIRSGNVKLVKLLLNNGSNVNGEDKNGCTPLHFAVEQGNPNIIELLLTSGAKVDIRNKDNITPLAVAVRKEHIDVVQLLLAKGASANVQDAYGGTSLHIAAKMQNLEIVKLLLKSGANAYMSQM